jgi:hypothetical protein
MKITFQYPNVYEKKLKLFFQTFVSPTPPKQLLITTLSKSGCKGMKIIFQYPNIYEKKKKIETFFSNIRKSYSLKTIIDNDFIKIGVQR